MMLVQIVFQQSTQSNHLLLTYVLLPHPGHRFCMFACCFAVLVIIAGVYVQDAPPHFHQILPNFQGSHFSSSSHF